MEHKAYEFDWLSFETELLASFEDCIKSDDTTKILSFIADNKNHISNPYDGGTLDTAEFESLLHLSTQEILDYSLTKYYSLETDFGLGSEWLSFEEALSEPLLGNQIKGFDPGLMGSYFQNPSMLKETLILLTQSESKRLKDFFSELKKITKGMYVTF